MEEKLQGAKLYSYEKLKVDIGAFETRLKQSLIDGEAPKRHFIRKKFALVVVPLLIVPLVGFAAYGAKSFMWSGTQISIEAPSKNPNLGSNMANPDYETIVIQDAKNKHHSLTESRTMAHFPIRVPDPITGWKKISSEGLTGPHYWYQNDKLVKVTETPISYFEVYTNAKGQRVSVMQSQDDRAEMLSMALQKQKDPSVSVGQFSMEMRRNATVLTGYGKDLAVYNPDVVDVSKEQKKFNEIMLYHIEQNETVTQLQIDEFGGVDKSQLEAFAQAYLKAPVQ